MQVIRIAFEWELLSKFPWFIMTNRFHCIQTENTPYCYSMWFLIYDIVKKCIWVYKMPNCRITEIMAVHCPGLKFNETMRFASVAVMLMRDLWFETAESAPYGLWVPIFIIRRLSHSLIPFMIVQIQKLTQVDMFWVWLHQYETISYTHTSIQDSENQPTASCRFSIQYHLLWD